MDISFTLCRRKTCHRLKKVEDNFFFYESNSFSEVVFMIDRSGSMGGQGIVQAKSAMHAILRQMEGEAGYTKSRFALKR